jgi:hypothetical protein
MQTHRFNWPIWAGFLLSWIALLSYFFVFVWFPVTRDVPWANLLLFGIAAVLVRIGVRRAFAPGRPRRAKITSVALATLSIALCGCSAGASMCRTVQPASTFLREENAHEHGYSNSRSRDPRPGR